MRIFVRLACLVFMLVVAVGCVSRTGGEAGSGGGEVTTTVPAPTAADGDDIDACADGECEIRLDDEMEIATPAGAISLSFADGRLSYEIVSADGGRNSGSVEGLCVATINIDGTGGGSVCYVDGELPPLEPGAGQLALQVAGADTDSPVLRMAVG
jgi:hypothetical protein